MERSDSDVKVWFWSRNSNVPSDVSSGATTINTDNWGEPFAYFPDTSCDIDSHFGEQNIIINLTFCEYPVRCMSFFNADNAIRWGLGWRCVRF